MIEQLRQHLLAQRIPGIENAPGTLPLGIAAIDTVLGGGLMRGALHEIAAAGESHFTAAAGFALGVIASSCPAIAVRKDSVLRTPMCRASTPFDRISRQGVDGNGSRACPTSANKYGHDRQSVLWVAEDMALAESGAPHGAGFDAFGLAPERLVMVSAAHRRDLLWAMEEALRCRTISTVIGEMRAGGIDGIAVRRLSLAAAESGALALLLRTAPPIDASTAATRWIVGAAPSTIVHGPGASRLATQLVRNRRGPTGSWILEWSDSDERFILATHTQPVAAPALDGSHRQVA